MATDLHFKKLYEFQIKNDWILPDVAFEAPHFEIPTLQQMKYQLNCVKSKLDDFDLVEWSKYTKTRDLSAYVIPQLKRRVQPELLTQAWCKFYEILVKFPLISPIQQSVKSLHLCEAPGAFVAALNHYLTVNNPYIEWNWMGNTLNPYYEGNAMGTMIDDDRLICHTIDHWTFGEDLTGDLMKYYNHLEIVQKGTADLVTADGSINCMKDPGEQEKLVEFLHYCEVMTALRVLSQGGNFVLKVFTIFEKSTVCLMYLLVKSFKKVAIFKPGTSKSGNSELYVVCLGFLDNIPDSLLKSLLKPYKNSKFDDKISMFDFNELPKDYLNSIIDVCKYFFLGLQCKTIENNIKYFLHPNKEEINQLNLDKLEIAKKYSKINRLKSIHISDRIMPNYRQFELLIPESFTEISLNCNIPIEIIYGKRIERIKSSKFADISTKRVLQTKNGVLYQQTLKLLQRVQVININSFKQIECYHKFQKDLFTRIANVTENSILFVKVPFPSQFLAQLWLILACAHEKVVTGHGWCLFYNKLDSKIDWLNTVFDKIQKAYENVPQNRPYICDVLYVVNLKDFSLQFDQILNPLIMCNK